MLEPEGRHLLLDALRPPPGYDLDVAVGTTFTLDLIAMLLPPIAFARYEVEGSEGEALVNPVARLDAIRRYARSITIFCQAGETKAPTADLPALAFLEDSVVPVTPPRAGGIFHPKVWLVRYLSPDGQKAYRLLCLSRNLTFDRSWDSVLRLDGSPSTSRQHVNDGIATFVRALPPMAVRPLSADRADACTSLATDVERVEWEGLPDGLTLERFWPLGLGRQATWPFPDDAKRMLVISPFVSPDAIARLTRTGRNDALISTPETIDQLGKSGLSSVGKTYVLDARALEPSVMEPSGEGQEAEVAPLELRGLHAKVYVADFPWWSRIWTGSANATGQAFERNVEFLVELRGRNLRHGVSPVLESGSGKEVGLGRLLMEYPPPDEPVLPTEKEELLHALDRHAWRLGQLRFTAKVQVVAEDQFRVRLRGSGEGALDLPESVVVRCRPATMGFGLAIQPRLSGGSLEADFVVSFVGLTAFFVLTLETGEGASRAFKEFVVPAELLGAPEERLDRVVHEALRSRSDLMRLLLLLLGIGDPSRGGLERIDIPPDGVSVSDPIAALLGSDSLLEPLVRAAGRNPRQIREIDRLVSQVARTDESRPPDERLVPPELLPLLAVLLEATAET